MPVTVSVIDAFNRANEAIDANANWTVRPFADGSSALAVVSNQVSSGGFGYSYAWYNATTKTTSGGTIEAAIQIPTLPGNGAIVFLALIQQPSAGSATGDAYQVVLTINTSGNDSVAIERIVDGSTAQTHGPASTLNWAAGDTLILRLTAAGGLTVVKDTGGTESSALSVSDTNLTGAFYFGIGFASDGAAAGRLDNAAFGNLSGGDATATAPAATGLGDFPAPAFQAGSTITSPAADALGDFPASEMQIGTDIAPNAAVGLGDFPVPTVTGTGDSTVTTPPADALGDFPIPALQWGSAASSPAATALGDFPVPTVTGTASATVTAVPADATGDFPVPVVSDGAIPVPLQYAGQYTSAIVRDTGETTVAAFLMPATTVAAVRAAETELVYA